MGRVGGVSQGAYSSLNVGKKTGDDPSHVEENIKRAALTLELPPESVFTLDQVHGDRVRLISEGESSAPIEHEPGDALLTRTQGIACGIRTADCVPILLACPRTGYVGAVHAGWKGAVLGIGAKAVASLETLGVQSKDLVAAIGPHISLAAFEVSDEVEAELAQASPVPLPTHRPRARPHVDLRRLVRAQLVRAGLEDGRIDDVFGCTLSDTDRYFSFRRDGKASGRQISMIRTR